MSKKLFSLVLTILTGTSWGCSSDMNGIWKQLKEGDDLSMSNTKVGKREAETLGSQLESKDMGEDRHTEEDDWGMIPNMLADDTSSEVLSPIGKLAKDDTNFRAFFAALKGINGSLEEQNVAALRKQFGAGAGKKQSVFTVNMKSSLHQTLVRLSANVFDKKNDYKDVPNTPLNSTEKNLCEELLKGEQLAMIKASDLETERVNKAGRKGKRDSNIKFISCSTQRQWIRQAQYDKAFEAIDQFIDETCENPLEDLKKIMPVLCSFWQAVGAIATDNVVPNGYKDRAAFDEEAKVLHNFHYAAVKLLKDDTLCNCKDSLKGLYNEYKEEVE